MIDLLLVADVPSLGKKGERVAVRSGYARNYLLPRQLAVPLTKENLAMVEKARIRWLAEEAKLLGELRELGGHIQKLDLKIVAKASDTGNLYGSVTERDIAAAAKAAGVAFDAKVVRLAHPLRAVGDHQVLIHLHEQLEFTIPVKIRAEGREDWIPGDETEEKAEYVSSDPDAEEE